MARTRFQPGRSILGPPIATKNFRDPSQENTSPSSHPRRQSGGDHQEDFFDLGIDNDKQFISDDGQLEENMDASKKSSNRRGPTRMHKIWARHDGDMLALTFNEFDQPIGDQAAQFTNFLGTVARSGKDAPLTYKDWRHMPLDNKKIMWNNIKLKYNLGDDNWLWVMKALGKKWKDFKCELKRKHYDAHKTYEERLVDRDSSVLPEQWRQMIEFWDTEEGQREIDVKTNNQPDLAKKGPKELDDLFSDVFGKEKHGRVRGLGLGPAPTHIWTAAPSPAACIRMATKARKKAEEETKQMKERMIVVEIELAEMKAMIVSILHNKSTDAPSPTNPLDGRQTVVDTNIPNDTFEGEVRSSSSNHQFPSYQVHQTKKRRVRYEHETEDNPRRDEKEVFLMSLGKPHRPVARGLLFSKDPSTIVGGEKLGDQYWEIYVEVVMIPTESLIRSYHGMKLIGSAARKFIAWPSYLVKPVRRLSQ